MTAEHFAEQNEFSDQENPLLEPIIRVLKREKTTGAGSNPALSANKELIVSRLKNPVDRNSDQMKPKYKGPHLYQPKKGRDWFVWLKYINPISGKYERFKFSFGFSDYHTIKEKREYGKALIIAIEELISEGWSPFQPLMEITGGRTIHDYIDIYLGNVENDLRPKTFRAYTGELTLFSKWLHDQGHHNIRIDQVSKNIVFNFLNTLKQKRSWSGKTYNNYLNDLTTFFNYFNKNFDGVIDRIPSVSMKRLPVIRKGNSYWNDWQFKELKERMLKNGDDFLCTFCSFIYYAALRNESEGNYIQAGDFNLNNQTLRVQSGTAKNRSTEYIPIYPDFLQSVLDLGINQMPPSYYIFSKDGIGGIEHVNHQFFSKMFRPYKKEMGVPDGEHGLYKYKHTRAVHLAEDGEDLYKIMRLFRHKDLATTMIYMRGLGVDVNKTEFTKGRRF